MLHIVQYRYSYVISYSIYIEKTVAQSVVVMKNLDKISLSYAALGRRNDSAGNIA
jgi:hypothetical protein